MTITRLTYDHLGSVTTITNSSGSIVQELSYDAWGNLRNPYTWSGSFTGTPKFDRGFTGHEHHSHFGLINMKFTLSERSAKLCLSTAERCELGGANGRMYDPLMCSFLSVDTYVQDPGNAQNFNRYAYCLNNPLKYTDPDGEWVQLVLAGLIGGTVNWISNGAELSWKGLAYFGIGAAAGVLGAAVGGAVAGGMKLGGFINGAASGALGGASSGLLTGSGNAWMQGASFGQGLKAGLLSAGIGAGTGALFGGLTRGYMDYSKGYSFWDGTRVINYEAEGVKIQELYPNDNFNYNDYQNKQCANFTDLKLQTRTKNIYGIKQGDMNIDVLTTHPDNITGSSQGYTLLTDGTYQTAKGTSSLGFTFETSTGYSEIHISPYAATHKNIAIFKAVVGHELTHGYHVSMGLPLSINGPSEHAALTYSKSVYEFYGMTNLKEATNIALQQTIYNKLYFVPSYYTFSPLW